MTASSPPRATALPRAAAMRLAATEYQRFLDMLRSLQPQDWVKPTECPGWDVRAMAAHALGMVEMAASIRESNRQVKLARRAGGVFLDALTKLQVDERAEMTPTQIVDRYAARAPKAARSRRRTPGFIRRRTLPIPQQVGGRDESWTIGYLIDVILTRDPWMHRIDISLATGVPLKLAADHDAVLVADVVAEWAARHGQPYRLRLTGPAGGEWASDQQDRLVEMDAIEFCRAVSGRGPADGLLTTQVPF
ncbi:MAG TPA: maleylpyruvate isomerase family mycothiol-dependent enzyme [Jatrophihabitans sp.]|nr:maleylpyruvate isomerase family mycothiol-dependent enzyme [Jatrophihabitans sp.]